MLAHRAIARALELTCAALDRNLAWQWVGTRDVQEVSRDLAHCTAIWLVPGSPYENTAGALAAVRSARETRRPFLGTCGGFQHAMIEFARHVAGLPAADHAETNPAATAPVISPLSCSLLEKTGRVHFAPDSRLREIYGRESSDEGDHCNYGLNPAYRAALEGAGLRFTGFDSAAEIRAAELPAAVHPFFIGTLFQPERAALRGEIPPLVRAFVAAIPAP